ncbi:NBR1-Ig-like domain-containing protein [Sphaerisporangium aureirubrum]|uniref:NBR1-Ig-like domain-containing protein n=1 Tax=Sphaerisporangium aureirubrum TaxID=1544736 RepID=A0ABW1NBT2_9ACTN
MDGVDDMTNDRQRSKRGRPWAPLKGDDPGLRALATWLRERCDESGLTLREAEKRISYSRDTISKNLAGDTLPEWAFVEALVTASTRDDARAAALLAQKARQRWEQAAADRPAGAPAAREAPESTSPRLPRSAPDGRPPSRRRRLTVAAAAGVLVVSGLVVAVKIWPDTGAAGPPAFSGLSTSAAPRPQSTHGPLVPGDDSTFVADVTVPDGSRVRAGQRFVKTWEIRNSGVIVWRNRFLTRQGAAEGSDLCVSPARTPIPLTQPGARIKISVPITAPKTPGSCRVDWKMTDAAGRHYFPDLAGLYLVVNVAGEP